MSRYDFNNRDQRKIAPQVLTFLSLRSYLLAGLYIMTKEKTKEYNKEYRLTHKEQTKKYYLTHKEQAKEYNRKHYQTPAGKIVTARKHNKRQRELGFEPLNTWFNGSHAHHIDNKRIVYIPKTIHIKCCAGRNRKLHRQLVLQYYGSLENMIAMARQRCLF